MNIGRHFKEFPCKGEQRNGAEAHRNEIKRKKCGFFLFCFLNLGKIAAGLYKDGNEHSE